MREWSMHNEEIHLGVPELRNKIITLMSVYWVIYCLSNEYQYKMASTAGLNQYQEYYPYFSWLNTLIFKKKPKQSQVLVSMIN